MEGKGEREGWRKRRGRGGVEKKRDGVGRRQEEEEGGEMEGGGRVKIAHADDYSLKI